MDTFERLAAWKSEDRLNRSIRMKSSQMNHCVQLRECNPTTGVTLTVAAGFSDDLEEAAIDALIQLCQ